MTEWRPDATIVLDYSPDENQATLGLQFRTPDGSFGIDMTLEEAAFFCYALHAACRDGLQLTGGEMTTVAGMRIERDNPDGTTTVVLGSNMPGWKNS